MSIDDVELTVAEAIGLANRHLKHLKYALRSDPSEVWYPLRREDLRRIILLLNKVQVVLTQVIADNE